jgi:hypothetical protein
MTRTVPPKKEPSLYNSRVIGAYVKYIRRKYPHVDIVALLESADMHPQEVDDQGHWFTQSQVDRFYENAVKVTRNANIAREAGRYAASPDSVGVMRQYVLGLATPSRVYERIGNTTSKLTKSSKYRSRSLGSNKVEIVVTPNEGTEEKSFQCENRKGFFEAILMMFNNQKPRIAHPQCMFRGDRVCRYILTWDKDFVTYYRIFRNYAYLLLLLAVLTGFAILPIQSWALMLCVVTAMLLGATLFVEHIDNKNLKRAIQNLRESSDQLVNQIEINYNNRLVTQEIGRIINHRYNKEDVLAEIVRLLQKRLDFDRGMIMLANKERTRLKFWDGFGYTGEEASFLKRLYFHLDNPGSKGAFVISFREQRPILINDINEIESTISKRSLDFAKKMGGKSFICCPIVCDKESIGILAVDNIRSKRLLVHSDMSLLMGISHFIGIFIRHTEHLEIREEQLKSILEVLISSIDARDPLTKGHSEWVAEYATGICDELGFDKEYREKIRIAALLHDYGKIGIPDSMLKKADRLTEHEYEYVKLHAEKTREILSAINFEGPLREIPEIAGSHHEKVDGTGYPMGLTGGEIPLGARIIAVADYFEARTANRHYNEASPPAKALDLLTERVGTHFDKQIVKAFIRYYKKNYGYLMEERKAGAS